MTREEFNKKYAWAHDAIRDGKKCKFWDGDKNNYTIGTIYGIVINDIKPFKVEVNGLIIYKASNCELVKTDKYIKEPAEAIRLLIENGYKFSPGGNLLKKDSQLIPCGMFEHFGTKLEITVFNWPDFLIEEREV